MRLDILSVSNYGGQETAVGVAQPQVAPTSSELVNMSVGVGGGGLAAQHQQPSYMMANSGGGGGYSGLYESAPCGGGGSDSEYYASGGAYNALPFGSFMGGQPAAASVSLNGAQMKRSKTMATFMYNEKASATSETVVNSDCISKTDETNANTVDMSAFNDVSNYFLYLTKSFH